jgi:dipeptidyl aminopeptidase/acylaminoacyl peptidase
LLLAPNQSWLSGRRLSVPTSFTIEGAQGDQIDGWLYAPIDRPIHGAPCVLEVNRGRFGFTFYLETQILAGRGCAVVMVNPHGSYGYGERFKAATHYEPATLEIEDFMMAVDAAIERGVDHSRVGVSGTSFGGFTVNWLVSHFPERFAAAVAQASYCNRHSLWGTSSIGPSRWDRPGPPWAEAEFLLARSPISYAPHVRTPMLMIHGSRDTICPLEQAAQWYTALTVLGREPVWLILEDEGHDLARSARPESRILRLSMIADWFDKHLGTRRDAPAANA